MKEKKKPINKAALDVIAQFRDASNSSAEGLGLDELNERLMLRFVKEDWSDADISELVKVLPMCNELRRLALDENPKMSAAAARLLAKALNEGAAPKLTHLGIEAGLTGKSALAKSKGVNVIVGYNKNVAKYTAEAVAVLSSGDGPPRLAEVTPLQLSRNTAGNSAYRPSSGPCSSTGTAPRARASQKRYVSWPWLKGVAAKACDDRRR